MRVWLVVIAAGVGSYLFRISMLVLAARARVPAHLERAARFAVPTAFAALAATALAQQARSDLGPLVPLGAVVVAIVAVRRTRSSYAALLAGMPAVWMLSALSH
jgi:branched-subunit amino acid transport protein